MKSPKEIGKILKETRIHKGLSLEKIYKQTRIQSRIVEALEDGNADRLLSRVYVILFLKEYASFLDLDGTSLVADYKAFYTDEEKQILDITKEPVAKIEPQKWMALLASLGLAFIFIFFTLFLGAKLKSSRRPTPKVAYLATRPARVIPQKKTRDKTQTIFPIAENRAIVLTLRSTDDVWMKVKQDGKLVFEGILYKKRKKEWSANDRLELWVGRAEALDFTINQKSIGKVGKGRIKSIQISRQGLKIGNKWLEPREK